MPSARRVNWARIRVAAVCLVALLILSTLMYLLTGGTLLQPKATLYMYVPDATGLVKGSPVRVDGIGVGKVSSVILSGSAQPARAVEVKIQVELERLSSIPVDSFAQLSTDTLIGDKYVDITSGKDEKGIAPGSELNFKDHPELMKSLDLSQFQKQLRIMDATLTDIEQGKGLVGEFVLGDAVYKEMLKKVGEFQRQLRDLADTQSSLGRALYSEDMYHQISQPVSEFEKSLEQIQSGQGSAGQFFRGTEQYEQWRASARDLLRSLRNCVPTI
jgi:phospholipid/cholesterol/gamma-HCH transport system substrate-binding protein